MFSGTQSIESSAFPYFQNPIWGKHIGKLEIRRSKYNKRLFSVSLGNSICAIKSVLTVLVDFPPKQTMSFFRDTIDKWLMALNVGEQNYCNIKTTYLIFVIFSQRIQFLAQFFSTQKRNKTDLATKQRESLKSKNCAKKQHKM